MEVQCMPTLIRAPRSLCGTGLVYVPGCTTAVFEVNHSERQRKEGESSLHVCGRHAVY